MKVGSKVRLKHNDMTSGEYQKKVGIIGDIVGVVGAITNCGICVVLLPLGVRIPGHSHPLQGDDREYIDVDKDDLEAA